MFNNKIIVLLFLFIVPVLLSQEKLFQPHDVFRIKSVDEVVLSPDGKYAAFSLEVPRSFDQKPGSNYAELYVFDYVSEESIPLLTGEVKVDDIGWTIDSKFVSFTAKLNDDKKSQLYIISADGSDTTRITDSKTTVIDYRWHPAENKLAFIAEEFNEDPPYLEEGFDQEVFEENEPGRNLYFLDFETGAVEQVNKEGAVFEFEWMPNGDHVVAAVAPRNLVDDSYMFKRLYRIDVDSGESELIVNNPGKLGNFAVSPDGNNLAFISAVDTNDAVDGSLFICSIPAGKDFYELRNYSKDFIGSVTDVEWLDNSTILFNSEEGVYTTLRSQKIEAAGNELLIRHEGPIFTSFSLSNEKVAFAGDTPKHPDELFTYSLDNGELMMLTNHNGWLNDVKLAEQVKIEYEAEDGLTIEGLLFFPIYFEEGKRYPMITYIHGGPESTNHLGWNTAYNRWGQSAAAKGFFVFMPNYRAGSGRGYEFTMTGYADAGGQEFKDVLDGINYLVDKGYVDKNRVGIGGGSYGGYFSAWGASKHTENFAAAVSFVGIGNQLVKRNTTDIPWESYYVHWGYWVNENAMEVYDRSPVRYAGKMNTPLLILHGTEDPRVHPSQSLEMYRAFKLRGNAPVRLVWYPGEEHGNKKNTSRLDYLLRTINWFEYYLHEDHPEDSKPSNVIDYNLEYFENAE